MSLHKPVLAVLALAIAAGAIAVPVAGAARASEWHYDVTVKAERTERWSYSSQGDIGLPGAPCLVVRSAQGTASTQLTSIHPVHVLVMRSAGKQPPALDVGTGDGVAVRGPSNIQGTDITTHAGAGDCATANPPQKAPTTDCGRRTLRAAWELSFINRGTVAPNASLDDSRSDCPTGPPVSVQWAGGVDPSLSAATALASPSKFYGTKQFTIHGERTFTASIAGPDKASDTVRWVWEMTYRRVAG